MTAASRGTRARSVRVDHVESGRDSVGRDRVCVGVDVEVARVRLRGVERVHGCMELVECDSGDVHWSSSFVDGRVSR
jgi:hypothetical protein